MSTCLLEYCLVAKGDLKDIVLRDEEDVEALKEVFVQQLIIPGLQVEQVGSEILETLFARIFIDLSASFPDHVAVFPRAVYDEDGSLIRQYSLEEAAAFMSGTMGASLLQNLLRRAANLLN
ncbi:MAG TPA: hypothetical protein VJ246_02800 [Patescibacteria group bacterium]|nr:hypothetical protein [Patescibacteria group bacterium]